MQHLNTNTWIDKIDLDKIPYCDNVYPTLNHLDIENKNVLINYARMAYNKAVDEAKLIFSTNNPFVFKDEFVFKNIMEEDDIYSNIVRLDFVKTLDGDYKLVEINADTPCAIPEAFYGNFVYFNIDEQEKALNRQLAEVFINECNKVSSSNNGLYDVNIAFAGSDEYVEDWANTKYLYDNFKRFNTNDRYHAMLVPLSKLAIYDDDNRCGVYVDDNKIDVLYRLHPIEMMIEDMSEDGYPVGLKLIELHYNNIVKLVNPPAAIFLQNKELFKYLDLPFIPKALIGNIWFKGKVIAKPVFGREGDGIQIFSNMQDCQNKIYHLSDYLVQEFIEQPLETIKTTDGELQAYITYSVFIINGAVSALYARASETPICDSSAFWIPCK